MNALALSSHARLALHWLREGDVPDTLTVSTRAVLEKATITLRRGQYRDLHLLGGVRIRDAHGYRLPDKWSPARPL